MPAVYILHRRLYNEMVKRNENVAESVNKAVQEALKKRKREVMCMSKHK